MHFGRNQAQRFHADEKFIRDNQIEKISQSVRCLLHSEDDNIVTRINNLTNAKSNLKLHHFGTSAVQELVGWFNPEKFPIRNNKADKALNLIGYNFPKTN